MTSKSMDPDFLNAFKLPFDNDQSSSEKEIISGEKRKHIQPSSQNDPKLEGLKTFLLDWINATLKEEHIVVKSIEEDIFDGLVLHHLLERLGAMKLNVQEIALSVSSQKHKLKVVVETVSRCLHLEESQLKWSVEEIYKKDLLATLHLLVAMAKHFQPDMDIPPNVSVEVLIVEPTKKGIKTEKVFEFITDNRQNLDERSAQTDVFDELFKLAPDKVKAVKQAIVHFVNKHLGNLGLTVKDVDSQFADGVILLLLIGQLEGYFLNLSDFFLTPCSDTEMLHNANLAVDLLLSGGLLDSPVNPEDIVNRDVKTTLRVLYSLFSKYKSK
ncbi:gamma-parvin [Rhinatrema bivittatum]|uniref:gamma-parvin n=1 Tax=Rhinatrema bivittatum TaxID=194408 RepID=UPI00112731BF|nr:gamma-parvin [Rhinatrema bivittatum]